MATREILASERVSENALSKITLKGLALAVVALPWSFTFIAR